MIVIILFQLLFCVVQWSTYKSYTANCNQALSAILQNVLEQYPDVNETELVQILNSQESDNRAIENFTKEYGIDLEKESLLLKNDNVWKRSILVNIILLSLFATGLLFLFLSYNHKKDKELAQITNYVEQINQRNYKLDIDSVSEDELSILKNEIYKTTVMLNEVAENEKKAKSQLKEALSDISHQLKTPLTTILIMLDNLLDQPKMEAEQRQSFIRMIRREIYNINFLVQSLLKLAKFDAEAVTFLNEEVEVWQIVKAAVKNLDVLCDLKNVTVKVTGENCSIICDYRWQVEAVTNVLKNCIEYSSKNGQVIVHVKKNPIYTSIIIQDFGPGIDEEDQRHIFERFYKGKNTTNESVGIGLALAKTIIEANRGHISVSSENVGTKFAIKYYN